MKDKIVLFLQEEQFGKFGTLRSVWVAVSLFPLLKAPDFRILQCTAYSYSLPVQRKPPGFAFGKPLRICSFFLGPSKHLETKLTPLMWQSHRLDSTHLPLLITIISAFTSSSGL